MNAEVFAAMFECVEKDEWGETNPFGIRPDKDRPEHRFFTSQYVHKRELSDDPYHNIQVLAKIVTRHIYLSVSSLVGGARENGWFGPIVDILPIARQILETICEAEGRDFAEVCEETRVISSTKNNDYSPFNIMIFGQLGVLVRMSDKSVRLWNLAKSKGENRQVADESMINTAMDMVNYAIYLHMLENANWLSDDQQESEFLGFMSEPDLYPFIGMYSKYFQHSSRRYRHRV